MTCKTKQIFLSSFLNADQFWLLTDLMTNLRVNSSLFLDKMHGFCSSRIGTDTKQVSAEVLLKIVKESLPRTCFKETLTE